MKKVLNFLVLFTSFNTLVCCALPALFVALGAGGVLVSVTSKVPQLIQSLPKFVKLAGTIVV